MKSLDKELSSFFTSISDKKYDLTSVTKGALTQSRAKLNHTAFIELSEMAVKDFYLEESYETWKGHRLLAIDGSCLNLPYHEDVINEFGYQYVGSKADIKRSMAKVSSCYDVLNGITLDSQIDGFKVSERVLMTKHFENVAFRRKDILLMDRGYPSIAIFYKLISKGVDFCIRMKTSWWKEVDNFSNSLLQSKVVEFTLPQKDMVLKKI